MLGGEGGRSGGRGQYLFQTEEYSEDSAEEEECADDIGGCVRIFFEPGDVSKELGVASCWVCEETAKDGTDNNPHIEGHG